MVLCNGQLKIGFLFWPEKEDKRKGFNIVRTPTLPDRFCIAFDPELQDNVLLPKAFTEYIHHVDNVSEMHSIIRSGLILGGQSLKRGGQSVFFTKVHPMEDDNCLEETPLDKAKDCSIQKTWKPHQNMVNWCNLELAQERGLQFYQTRSHAIVLYSTLPAVCIEKVLCMKAKNALYQKVRLTPRVPRVVLKPNSQIGPQDER